MKAHRVPSSRDEQTKDGTNRHSTIKKQVPDLVLYCIQYNGEVDDHKFENEQKVRLSNFRIKIEMSKSFQALYFS